MLSYIYNVSSYEYINRVGGVQLNIKKTIKYFVMSFIIYNIAV